MADLVKRIDKLTKATARKRQPATKTYPAQIVFDWDDFGTRGEGRRLNPRAVIDTQNHNRPLRPGQQPVCTVKLSGGRWFVMYQGGERGGRRRRQFVTNAEAVKSCVRWAGRRFRIPE